MSIRKAISRAIDGKTVLTRTQIIYVSGYNCSPRANQDAVLPSARFAIATTSQMGQND